MKKSTITNRRVWAVSAMIGILSFLISPFTLWNNFYVNFAQTAVFSQWLYTFLYVTFLPFIPLVVPLAFIVLLSFLVGAMCGFETKHVYLIIRNATLLYVLLTAIIIFIIGLFFTF